MAPEPRGALRVGPLVDVGVYPLTIVTAMFGPVRRVSAYATTVQPERTRKDGWTFQLADAGLLGRGVLELEDGVVMRLTATF